MSRLFPIGWESQTPPSFCFGPHQGACKITQMVRTTEFYGCGLAICSCGRVTQLPVSWQVSESIVFYNSLTNLIAKLLEQRIG